MMDRSIDDGRWNAAFRPRRLTQFLAGSVLVPWLCVWAVGEAFAAGVLLAAVGHPAGSGLLRVLASLAHSVAPDLAGRFAWREIPGPQNSGPLALSFLAAWLAIWTAAGIVAILQMARLLWSEDRIAWDGAGVEIVRRTGPFRSRRSWRADQVEHLSLSRADRALLLHTRRRTHALTAWGSREERAAVRDEIRRVLRSPARSAEKPAGAEAPAGWATSVLADGATLLVRDPAARRRRATAAWTATVMLAAAAAVAYGHGYLDAPWGPLEGVGPIAAALALAAAAVGSAWVTTGGTEIVLRKRAIEFRRGWLGGRTSETLEPFRLSVEHTTDDDGDDWFELQARSGERRRTIERDLDESENVLRLGRWIADRSGATLDLGRGVEEWDEERALAA